MPVLRAKLLGPPRFAIDDAPLEVRAAKARGLLCYLVATRHVHSRDRLAGFFWPDVPERNALASLRTALYDLRKALGDEHRSLLFVERRRVGLSEKAELELDTETLEALGERDAQPLEQLEAAVEAYRGPFLEGFSLPDAYDFDDWVFLERERLSHLYLGALCRLGEHYAANEAYERAADMARRVLSEDPLREDVHRALMRYYALSGQRAAAVAQYERCAELLARELDIEPLGATKELYARVRDDRPLAEEGGGPAPVARAAAARRSLVLAPTPDPLAVVDTAATLVGRRAELEQLDRVWQRARAGHGGVVLLAGEPGVGKSRLVRELAASVGADAAARTGDAEPVVLVGRCHEATASQPYGPVVDALRRALEQVDLAALDLPEVWLRELARLLPELEAALPDGANAPLDGVRDRDRLFEGVRTFLAAVAAARPTLLVLEDVHWSDETTLSLLGYVARSAAAHRLMIVGTLRAAEAGAERAKLLRVLGAAGKRIELGPLGEDDTIALVGALSGSDERPVRFGKRLHRRTGGNPLFTVETLRALFEQGSLRLGDGGWTTAPEVADDDYAALPVPESVGLIIDGRLDRLSDDARRLLECAAVLRRDFAFELVQSASGLPAPVALDGLDALTGLGLVHEVELGAGELVPRYDFAHALVRDRVYQQLSGARRQYLHRQVAGLLESTAGVAADRLAYHYTRGGVRDRAVRWALRAGRAALDVYAGEAALEHFRSASELAASDEESYLALAGMGDAAVGLGRPSAAIDHYEAAMPHAPDNEARAELQRRIGRAFERQGAYDRALDAYGEARRCLSDAPRSMASVRIADGLATVYVRLGRTTEAAALCHDALAWLEAHPEVERRDEAVAWVRNTLGLAYMHAGDYPTAVENLEQSLELKRQLDDVQGEATLLNNLGVVHYHCGADEAALEYYAASLALKTEIGDGYGRAIALTNLALIETHLEQYDVAAEHLAAAEDAAGDVGAAWLMPEIYRVAAQHALAVGDRDAAREAAERSLAAAEELGVPAFIGVAHRVLGLVTVGQTDDLEAAAEHFHTSLAVFEMLEDQHELAKTQAAYGEVLVAEGLTEEAVEQLEAAIETFRRSGATGRLERVERLLGDE